jgi:hypothetical protein
MLLQAFGGGIAVVVGPFVFNSVGPRGFLKTIVGNSSLQNSFFALIQSQFNNCSVKSSTNGPQSGALGTSSVYGGAVAIIQAPQIFRVEDGLSLTQSESQSNGANVSMLILYSSFVSCFALALSCANGPLSTSAGGAVYISGTSISQFLANNSIFSSNFASVACGAAAGVSNSNGGALALEVVGSIDSVAAISSCRFTNCTVNGAGISSLGVRGGALSLAEVAFVSVTDSQFINCSVTRAIRKFNSQKSLVISNAELNIVVNGGAGASFSFARSVSMHRCLFDATGGLDDSETSAGLLVLLSDSHASRLFVSESVFVSSQVVLSVYCASSNMKRSAIQCSLTGSLLIHNSSIFQVPPLRPQVDFDLGGSALMTLHSGVSLSSVRTRLMCANDAFAVFKDTSDQYPIVEFACKPCSPFHIASSSDEVWLEDVVSAADVGRCFPLPVTTRCPFGISRCQTFVYVFRGFWARFNSTNGVAMLSKAQRCPRGYCDCGKSACRLMSSISINHTSKSLCSGQRTGPLCGGCPSNFTQSLDGISCISNEDCSKNLWWVWIVSLLGFAVIALIIVPVSNNNTGALSCILFYFQISSFASSFNDSTGSNAIVQYVQIRSIVALHSRSCYARDMSAYDATAARLLGPVFVFVFSLAWTRILRLLQPLLHQRGAIITVSYGGTAISAFLFVFSSAVTVFFTLVECTSYNGDSSGVVFIDGTIACSDGRWKGLIVVVALTSFFPVAFAAALKRSKLPDSARAAVCSAYTDPMFYWGAVTLGFRLLISATQFLRVDYPNLLAFVRSYLSLGMLILLFYSRPYKFESTFWLDVVCYMCLIAQFGMQSLDESLDFLGITLASNTPQFSFFVSLQTVTAVFR